MQQKDVNGKGEWFVNSGVENFGIKGRTDRPAKVFPAGTITVDFWGNANYRDEPYKLATHNHVFSLSGSVIRDRRIGLYLVAAMSFLPRLFSYANMGTWPKIREQKITLPVVSPGSDEIDFEYMDARIRELEDARIRELEDARIRELEAYLRAAGFGNCDLTEEEQTVLDGFAAKTIRPFKIGKLFDIHPTKAYHLTNKDIFSNEGTIPVVSNGSVNNGIGGVTKLEVTESGNKITFSDTTTSDAIFYQPEDFVGYPHVQGLYALNESWTEGSLLYFVAAFRAVAKGRFDYATKFTRAIASDMDVLLPVDDSGEPDLSFMETFIRAQMKEAVRGVWAWRGRELAATRRVASARAAPSREEWGGDYEAPMAATPTATEG